MRQGILKIGGSCFANDAAYVDIGREIADVYDFYDLNRLFVVVSAKKGVSDLLISNNVNPEDEFDVRKALQGIGASHEYNNPYYSGLFLQGEIDSAYQLRESIPLDDVVVLDQNNSNFPIVGNTDYLSAKVDPIATLDNKGFVDSLSGVVIVAGYGGLNHEGEKVLYGRNASDLVAAWIGRLSGDHLRIGYLKDVDGVYQDFGTADQKRIDYIGLDQLMNFEFGKVLDQRVASTLSGLPYEVIVGDLHDMGSIVGDKNPNATLINMYQ